QDDVKLLGAVANHVAVAIQNQERFEERTRLAVIEERNRFGRDVHDSAAQSLGGAILQLELLQRNLVGQPAAAELLPKIRESLRRCLSELRRAIHNLQPVAGGNCENFIAAIQKRLKMLGAEANIEVEWATFGRMCELPETVQSHLFHIANEAVANACRHSGAERVRVELHFMAQRLRLFISDNGRGFDWARALAHARQHNRLGLMSLNERAQLLGAQLVVETRPGFGTKIRVELPLRRMPEPEPIIVDRLS
ncbi:MAG TPA: sensor histidine kinase, partial [Limnochordia bacterium]|nr:sensor histidine kinase [Limnochordia bacterium]